MLEFVYADIRNENDENYQLKRHLYSLNNVLQRLQQPEPVDVNMLTSQKKKKDNTNLDSLSKKLCALERVWFVKDKTPTYRK
jgi:hypothetical protein